MSEVCREFGVSRQTGYKIFERYTEHGLEVLSDRSRRPARNANQLPAQIEDVFVRCKREKPHWAARKIRERLVRRLDGDFRVPAKSTVHAVLCPRGLVKIPSRPRRRAAGTALSPGLRPMISGAPTSRASSSSATDATAIPSPSPTTPHGSCCSAKPSNRPARISPSPRSSSSSRTADCRWRSDRTTASRSPAPTGCSISRSSGCGGSGSTSPSNASSQVVPSRTAATSACISRSSRKPLAGRALNGLQQQAKFDEFSREFNEKRPHEALSMKRPAEVYDPSPRPTKDCPTSLIPSTTATSSSQSADGSTSPPSSLASVSGSRRSTTVFGSSAS